MDKDGDTDGEEAQPALRQEVVESAAAEIEINQPTTSARARELQQRIMLLKAADGKPQSVAREEQQPSTARGKRHFNLAHVDMQARNATDAEAPLELDEGLALGPTPNKRICSNHVHVQTDTPEDRSSINKVDESMTCSLCFSSWQTDGIHSMVCLKCGHIFGESCIKHLLKSHRVCPICRKKALLKDIRLLHAQPMLALDRTEEHELRKELEDARCSIQSLTSQLATNQHRNLSLNTQLKAKLDEVTCRNETLTQLLKNWLAEHND